MPLTRERRGVFGLAMTCAGEGARAPVGEENHVRTIRADALGSQAADGFPSVQGQGWSVRWFFGEQFVRVHVQWALGSGFLINRLAKFLTDNHIVAGTETIQALELIASRPRQDIRVFSGHFGGGLTRHAHDDRRDDLDVGGNSQLRFRIPCCSTREPPSQCSRCRGPRHMLRASDFRRPASSPQRRMAPAA